MSETESFEALQKELEDVVASLERGDVPVDDAIALFRRGEELYRACVERLQAAELRIEELDARSEIHGGPDDGHDTAPDRHPPSPSRLTSLHDE
jgi:exodeoxyribonuclease VII small subunit